MKRPKVDSVNLRTKIHSLKCDGSQGQGLFLERHKGNQHVVRDNVELAAVPDPLIY